MSDADLAAKIARYEAAIEEVDLGGGVSVIAGEGRRMEYVQANVGAARQTLEDLYWERSRRQPDLYPRVGRAIRVDFRP